MRPFDVETVEVYADSVGAWRWAAFDGSGRELDHSTEGFADTGAASRDAAHVYPHIPITVD